MIGSDIIYLDMSYTYSKKIVMLARGLEKTAFYIYRIFSIRKPKIEERDEIEKILIIEPFNVGDVASLSVMIDPLRNKFPETPIYIFTKTGNENIFEFDQRVNVVTSEFPWSDNSKKWSLMSYFKLAAHIFQIRKQKISIGIDPRGDIRSQLILLMTGCRRRLGYTNYINSNIITRGLLLTQIADKPASEHRYDWNLNLLNYIGVKNIYPVKFPSIDYAIDKEIKKKDEIPVLLHPGGGWIHRQWPINNWIKLIKNLSENKKIKITVIGGNEDKAILARIFTSINDERIEFKTTNLKDLIASIKNSDLFICLEGGSMNLAVCLDKPVIALFGPGDSNIWRPYSSKNLFIHKKENFPCNPCLQKKCYYPDKNCMAAISVDDVVDSVKSFFNTVKDQNNFNYP